MPCDKFLLEQLTFNGRANNSMMKRPKQSDCLKWNVLKNKNQNKIRDIN